MQPNFILVCESHKKLNLDPLPFDDEERDLFEALEKGLEEGSLVSHLTPERRAELQEAAKATKKPTQKANIYTVG